MADYRGPRSEDFDRLITDMEREWERLVRLRTESQELVRQAREVIRRSQELVARIQGEDKDVDKP